MGRLIAVTSGKGGVGKSNVSVRLAESLSAEKNKTLLIDLDAGMRCLDLLLGVTDSLVFDLGDILENEKAPEEVILNTKNSNIDLIAAPLSGGINADKFGAFLKNTALEYDFIILDFPAGVVDGLYAALPKYTEVLVVCNADAVSVRDAAVIGKALNKLKLLSVRLILNRADFKFMKQGMNANIDEVIDRCGIRLIAVIPQSMDIYFSSCKGEPLKKNTKAAKAFGRLAKRILGYDIPFQSKKL
jgi:septum site-determining protein MinD